VDFVPGISLFAVFDGHGGVEVAKYCEHHIVEELTNNAEFKNKNYEKALIEVFLKIDRMLLEPAGDKELKKIHSTFNRQSVGEVGDFAFNAGCTANVLLITPTHVYCANAGDSRSVMSRNNTAMELSEDHKPDLPSEKSRVLASGHMVEDGRVDGIIAISRAIGDWEYKDPKLPAEKMAVSGLPEVTKMEIKADTQFVICACDGIWDCMTSQEAVDFVGLAKEKISNYRPEKSPTKTSKKDKSSLRAKKDKKVAKMENAINNSKFKGLATVVEMMMDMNCPKDLAVSEGLGADNMTAIIVEFKK
jgi:serine/threonine protein phosphatase PrpC